MDLQSSAASWAARGATGVTRDASRTAAPSARHGVVMDELLTKGEGMHQRNTRAPRVATGGLARAPLQRASRDRKSTRLNSSHSQISYAVFCLKKKKNG